MASSESPRSEDYVRLLLARAAELDATISVPTQLAELRVAALEAGIHPIAFDTAVRELAILDHPRKRSVWSMIRQNALAAGAFWLALELVVQPLIWLDLPGPARTLGMLIATAAGIQIADRLRARFVRTALIAVGAGQAVLFAFHLAGIASAGANVLTWAVFFTGILATVTAALYGHKDRLLRVPTQDLVSESIKEQTVPTLDSRLEMVVHGQPSESTLCVLTTA